MTQRITRTDEGGVCSLTLNRPEKLNALDTLAFEELTAHLTAIAADQASIGCVVLRGSGRGFCAGADIDAMGKVPVDPRFKPRVVAQLGELPQPVIAAVHGVCFTGGLELALACNFIVADETARFADTHGKWGMVATWGMTQRLPRKVGTSAAMRMMMTSREVKAAEAEKLGLIDILAPTGELDKAVSELTRAILANSWHTNFAAKRLINETQGMPLAQAIAHDMLRNPGFGPDYEGRVAKFKKS